MFSELKGGDSSWRKIFQFEPDEYDSRRMGSELLERCVTGLGYADKLMPKRIDIPKLIRKEWAPCNIVSSSL